MELLNEALPPIPNGSYILPQDSKMETNIEVNMMVNRDSNSQNLSVSQIKLQAILMKHLKIPVWESKEDPKKEEKITIKCNFHHTFQLSADNILKGNVRCPQCRVGIEEIAKKIYETLDEKLFKVVRINRYGQLVLRCVENNHKIRLSYDVQSDENELPEYCPECIVESNSPPHSSLKDEAKLAEHLEAISLGRGLSEGESDEDWDEYFKYDTFLHQGGDLDMEDIFGSDGGPSDEDTYKNYDFDLLGDPETGYAMDSDPDQDPPDNENYFDSISMEISPKKEKSLEEQVREEFEDPQINYIISTIVSRNHKMYAIQKEAAIERQKKSNK